MRTNINTLFTAILGLAITFTINGCAIDDINDIDDDLEFEASCYDQIDEEGEVPCSVIPNAIRDKVESSMPIYSGTTPPDISGEYLVNSLMLVGSNLRSDVTLLNVVGKWEDKYFTFVKDSDGKLSYKDRYEDGDYLESDEGKVEVVGSGNNFTAYFVTTGVAEGISNKTSMIISGTLTSTGISNFHYAVIMLEKDDPKSKLMPKNTFRAFKENDDLAERYNWL